MSKTHDFCGWATRNNLKCADGRVIMKDAFKHNDGKTVPLVWNHQHNEPDNTLGHALLENREEGVYAYGYFNDTESGKTAKTLVEHGDIKHLSIYANQLRQQAQHVMHGSIREVSLVLAGANPGAYIESVIKHGISSEEEGYIFTDEFITAETLKHSEEASLNDSKKTKTEGDTGMNNKEIFDSLTSEQKLAVYEHLGIVRHADASSTTSTKEKTVKDVFDELTEEQKTVVYALIGQAIEDAQEGGSDDDDDDNKSGGNMKHNVFDTSYDNDDTLIHADIMAAIADGKKFGSIKTSFLEHGIEDVEYLFPDAKNVTATPQFITRDMGWVQKVMSGVHNTPFSRIKSIFADLTEDDARARGYLKGSLKKEEVFTLLKRTTTPTTIYKKQKMDRDDVVDIVDFDVIAWLKGEMRMMLDEEIARAILVGDGRNSSSDEKINEGNIRPIWKDDALYTIKAVFEVVEDSTDDVVAKAFIKKAIKARKDYKGSGDPVLFTTEDMLTNCLLMEDTTGRIIYDSVAKLATVLRVREIITTPVMEDLTRTSGADTLTLAGIIVNLKDYNVGADKGGAVNMFDDFDIDYNAQKYLIETRCSGALTKPYSAIALEMKEVKAQVQA